MTKNILRIKNGNVELINGTGQRIRLHYWKGDAERVDWYEEDKGSVQVQFQNEQLETRVDYTIKKVRNLS